MIFMKANNLDGKFIVIEGIDGSGLSTQSSEVLKRLNSMGKTTYKTKEPTDGPVGAILRLALTHRIDITSGTFALLFAGDKLTAAKKEKLLLESAKSIVSNQSVNLGTLADYSFTRSWMRSVYESLSVMSKTDRNYSSVRIIVRDRINDTPVFLCFGNNAYPVSDGSRRINRVDYIFETSLEQRKYLESVFNDKKGEALFSADDGSYELYFPVIINNRVIVFYFTDRQAYGKIGS